MVVNVQANTIGYTTQILILGSWFAFGLIFFLRKRPPKLQEVKRASVARWGILLQAMGFGLVWSFRRRQWWPVPSNVAGEIILSTLAVVLAWGSNWWCLWSVQTLGKQWTVQARIVRGHELITGGPYGIVRNPIYLGMFGLLIATGLALSTWPALLSAVVVFLTGNQIRIRAEEALLRESFGSQFAEYAARVPPFLPRVF